MSADTSSAEQKIATLGIELPPAPHPLGAYAETVQSGRLLFVAGTIPTLAGKLQYAGTIGKQIDLASGQHAARLAALNAVAAARQHLGSLDRITCVLKTEVYMVTTEDLLEDQPKIADGASLLLLQVFGDRGYSVRKIVGVAGIALNAPVAVELLFEVD